MHGPPWAQGRLRNQGFRVTLPRQVILDTLFKAKGHLSAEDIYFRIHPLYQGIGLTTVYRTLELLTQMGLISRFDFGDRRARYEFIKTGRESNHHHHLVCTNCGRVIDYTDFIDEEVELLNQTEKELSKKYHFEITNHLIQFYGLCDRCKKG